MSGTLGQLTCRQASSLAFRGQPVPGVSRRQVFARIVKQVIAERRGGLASGGGLEA